MKIYAYFFFFYVILYTYASAQTFNLTSATGNITDDGWKCTVTDRDGNTILAGVFMDSVQIGDSLFLWPHNQYSMYITKLNKQGKPIWIRKEYNNLVSDPQSITVDRDGNILLAYYGNNANYFTSQQMFTGNDQGVGFVKLSGDGVVMNRQFIKSYYSEYNSITFIRSLAFDTLKNVFFTGGFAGKISIKLASGIDTVLLNDSSSYDVLVGKLDSSLHLSWVKRLYDSKRRFVPGGSNSSFGNGVAVDQQGNVVFVGEAKDSLYLDTTWQNYLANEVLDPLNRFNSPNPWILKYTTHGKLLWGKMGQNPLTGTAFGGVHIDAFNNIMVCGTGIGGYQASNPYFISDTGNVYQKQTGFIFNKFAPDGRVLWLKSTDIPINFLGTGMGTFLKMDSAGNFYVMGAFKGYIDFDPGPGSRLLLSTNGNLVPNATDFAVAKYSKTGQLLWVSRTTGTLFDPFFCLGADYNPKNNTVMICGDYSGILTFNGVSSPSYTSHPPNASITIFPKYNDGFFARISNNCLTRTQIRDTICFGGTKSFDGETLSKPGKYIRLKSYNPANQCEVWEELYLYVRPEIQANAGADASVCSGKSQQLGTDSLSGLSYQWQQIGGTFTSTQATPIRSYTNFSDSVQRYRFALRVTDAKGCQKRDTITLSIAPVLRDTLMQAICPGENFLGYDTAGTYTDTLVSSLGCDSIRTLALSLKPNRTFNQSIRLCKNQSLQVGSRIYTQPGIYLDTLTASNGCDSLITSTLNYDIPNDTIQLSAQFGAVAAPDQDSYQWLDCNLGFTPIAGETDSSFAPSVSGSYAVRVTKGACADTSNCLLITSSSRIQHRISELEVFPNPNSGKATVRWRAGTPGEKLWLSTVEGKLIKILVLQANQLSSFSGLPKGVYVVKPERGGARPVRVMVE